MEQLIRKESQKILDQQMREARIQRQLQVRQQSMAWTKGTRRKFEEAKEREIKDLADIVTAQVQHAAVEGIQLVAKQNDLALAEIGMAHRAAAGVEHVERLKSLKRLNNLEAAKSRGSAAMSKQIKVKEAESARKLAVIKRKEDVRRAEDSKSKVLISRRPPLLMKNSDLDKRLQDAMRPPEYQQNLAKTLRVVSSATSPLPRDQPEPKTKLDRLRPQRKYTEKIKVRIPKSSSLERLLEKEKEESVTRGTFSHMARIKVTNSLRADEKTPTISGLVSAGIPLRNKYRIAIAAAATTVESSENRLQSKFQQQTSIDKEYEQQVFSNKPELRKEGNNVVRYYDASIPKGEVKYIAPKGLSVKEVRNSPDAWEKGQISGRNREEMEKKNSETQKEINKKIDERGKSALRKAKLEKQLLEARTELFKEIQSDVIGNEEAGGAFLGLADKSEKTQASNKSGAINTSFSSDEFSAVESDEEYIFPESPKTLKSYAVAKDERDDNAIKLVPLANDGSLSSSTPEQFLLSGSLAPTRDSTTAESPLVTLKIVAKKSGESSIENTSNESGAIKASFSPDEFLAVESGEEYIVPESPKTLKSYAVTKDERDVIKLVPLANDDSPSSSAPEQLIQDSSKQTPSPDSYSSYASSSPANSTKVSTSSGTGSSLGSTVAEIKIGSLHSNSSIDLQIRAKQQEKLLQEITPPSFARSQSISGSSAPTTDSTIAESPLFTLKIATKKSGDSSIENTSGSTDYFNLPEGPFTSTPDGNLKLKRGSIRSTARSSETDKNLKKRVLLKFVQSQFLTRKPESIANLAVSTSSSSLVRIDPEALSLTSLDNSESHHSYSSSGNHSSLSFSGGNSSSIT